MQKRIFQSSSSRRINGCSVSSQRYSKTLQLYHHTHWFLPMRPRIVVLEPTTVHRFHLRCNSNPMRAKHQRRSSSDPQNVSLVRTVSKLIRSWLGWIGGRDTCKFVNVRNVILSCTNLRKLIKSYSRRSCSATCKEMMSFKCTPLNERKRNEWRMMMTERLYMIGILKPSHSARLRRYWA